MAKGSTTETSMERFEKRLAEMEARLTWKIFSFWVGQVIVMIAVLEVFFRFFR